MSNRGDLLRTRAQFKKSQAKQETRLNRFLALMGDGAGNLAVAGSPLFVYVRVQGRGVAECLNTVAPLRNDLPIIVGYDFKKPDTLQVLSIYEGGMASFGPYAYLPAHHQAHEFRNADGGDDVVWVQKQAVIPLLCRPTSPTSMFVEILEDNYPWLSGWNLFPTTTSADLTARIPAGAGEARFVLIYVVGATNLLGYSNGAIFPAAWPPGTAFSLTPAPPAGSVPVVSVYLPNGITAIDWPNLYDVRLFNQPIGGSVTPGPHALLDNAVHSDTVTNTPPAQGSLVVADATPEWDELVHPGGAGYALTTDATDVIWDQTPTWTGAHTFNAGLVVGAGQGITLPDPGWIGIGPAASRLTMATGVPDVAEFVGFGQLNVENVLGHIGDADTYLIFAPDSIVLRAGGVDMIHTTTVGVDRVVINVNEDDVDFIVNASGLADALLVDGATGAISVTGPSLTVPAAWDLIIQDNVADAFSIDDNGAADVFLQIVTTTGSEEVIFNAGGDDVDFTVQAIGVADALQVRGSDGQITLGVLTAGFVKSSAGGVLSVALEVALAELAGYAQGSIIRGGAADWEALAHPGAAGYALVSDATDIVWDQTPLWTDTHSFMKGIIFASAVSGVNDITIPDNLADALHIIDNGDADVYLQIKTLTGSEEVIFNAGEDDVNFRVAASGITNALFIDGATGAILVEGPSVTVPATWNLIVPDNVADAFGLDDTGGLEYLRINSQNANPYFLIDPTGAGINVGIGTPTPPVQLAIRNTGPVADSRILLDTAISAIAHGGYQIYRGNPPIEAAGYAVAGAVNHYAIGSAVGDLIVFSLDAANNLKMMFATGAGPTARVTILGGGDVGIGLIAPAYRLDVLDDVANGYAAQFFNDGDNVNRHGIVVQCGADAGGAVGTTYYLAAWDGNGGWTGALQTVNGVFGLADLSDERHKANIRDTEIVGLDIVNGLKVRDFNWRTNPDGPVMTSFIAQEAQKVYPAMVSELGDDVLGTSRAMLIPILAKAIQEIDTRLTKLEARA